jgi:hypothetical protein
MNSRETDSAGTLASALIVPLVAQGDLKKLRLALGKVNANFFA